MSEQTTAPAATKTQTDPFRFGWRYVDRTDEKGTVQVAQIPLTLDDVLHPLDGDVIVSNDYHGADCIYLRNALLLALNGLANPRVFMEIHIDLGLEGVKPVVPDVAIYSGVMEGWNRKKTFYPAQVGARPELVIEITSPSTRTHDLNTKPLLYARAGFPCYAIVDYWPELDEHTVMVLGYRLTPLGYVRLPADERGRVWLEPVRLWLAPDGERVALIDEHGQRVPAAEEIARNLKQTDARNEELQSETEAAILAKREAEKGRKEAQEKADEAEKARKEAQEKAAEADKARKEAQDKAAEAEKQRADLLAKYAEMEAELYRLRGKPSA